MDQLTSPGLRPPGLTSPMRGASTTGFPTAALPTAAARERGIYSDLTGVTSAEATSGPKFAYGGEHEMAAQLIPAHLTSFTTDLHHAMTGERGLASEAGSTVDSFLAMKRAQMRARGGNAAYLAAKSVKPGLATSAGASSAASSAVDGGAMTAQRTLARSNSHFGMSAPPDTPAGASAESAGASVASSAAVAPSSAAAGAPQPPHARAALAAASGGVAAAAAAVSTADGAALPASALDVGADVMLSGQHAGVPLRALEPKVYVARAPAKATAEGAPRRVAVERRKREFAALHERLPDLLAAHGVDLAVAGGDTALPPHSTGEAAAALLSAHAEGSASGAAGAGPAKPMLDADGFPIEGATAEGGVAAGGAADGAAVPGAPGTSAGGMAYASHEEVALLSRLPLCAFDNEQYESREPADWLGLGLLATPGVPGARVQRGVPAQALDIVWHSELAPSADASRGVSASSTFSSSSSSSSSAAPALTISIGGGAGAGSAPASRPGTRGISLSGAGGASARAAAAGTGSSSTAAAALTSGKYVGVWRPCRVVGYDAASGLFTVVWTAARPGSLRVKLHHGPAPTAATSRPGTRGSVGTAGSGGRRQLSRKPIGGAAAGAGASAAELGPVICAEVAGCPYHGTTAAPSAGSAAAADSALAATAGGSRTRALLATHVAAGRSLENGASVTGAAPTLTLDITAVAGGSSGAGAGAGADGRTSTVQPSNLFSGPCPLPVPVGVASSPVGGPAHGWAAVPRLHLVFLAENPQTHAERLTAAALARRVAVSALRFHLAAGAMPPDADLRLPHGAPGRIAALVRRMAGRSGGGGGFSVAFAGPGFGGAGERSGGLGGHHHHHHGGGGGGGGGGGHGGGFPRGADGVILGESPIAAMLREAESDLQRTMAALQLAHALTSARAVLAKVHSSGGGEGAEGGAAGAGAATARRSSFVVGGAGAGAGGAAGPAGTAAALFAAAAPPPLPSLVPSQLPPFAMSSCGGVVMDSGALRAAAQLLPGTHPDTGLPLPFYDRALALRAPAPPPRAQGKAPVPHHDFNGNLDAFAFHCLFTRPEAAVAAGRVLGENARLWRGVSPFAAGAGALLYKVTTSAGCKSAGGVRAAVPRLISIAASALLGLPVTGAAAAVATSAAAAAGGAGAASAAAHMHALLAGMTTDSLIANALLFVPVPAGASTAAGGAGGSGAGVGGAAAAPSGGGGAAGGSGGGVTAATIAAAGGVATALALTATAASGLFAPALGTTKPLRLDEFDTAQASAAATYAAQLRDGWSSSIRGHVRACLKDSGKGHFNIKERDPQAYAFSKLQRLLRVLTFRMADELRAVVDAQLLEFAAAIEAACAVRVDIGGPSAVALTLGAGLPGMAEAGSASSGPGSSASAASSGAGAGALASPAASSASSSRRMPLFLLDLATKDVDASRDEQLELLRAGGMSFAASADGSGAGSGSPTPAAAPGSPRPGAGAGDASPGGAGDEFADTPAGRILAAGKKGAAAIAELRREACTALEGAVRVFSYSAPASAIVAAPLSAFDRALKTVAGVPQLERGVLEDMFWPSDPSVPTVSQYEEHVTAVRERLAAALGRATAPLDSYLATYARYVPFLNLDVGVLTDGLRDLLIASAVALPDVTAVVAEHRASAAAVLEELPASVSLGLVQVTVSEVRSALARKHREVADGVLRLLASFASDVAAEVVKAQDAIVKQLSGSAGDIEAVSALREFMATVPDKAKELKSKLSSASAVYATLAELNYQMPRDQFDLQWKAEGGAARIMRKLGDADANLDGAKGRFLEEMATEQAEFDETLNALNSDVAGLAVYVSIDQVSAAYPLVNKVRVQLEKAAARAQLFNAREALFGKEPTEYEKLSEIKKTFEPFQALWETVASWLKWKESWMNDRFTTLNPEVIERDAGNAGRNMARSVKAFERLGLEGCLAIARKVRDEVDGFKPLVPLITALRNPGMRERHWNELSEAIGIAVNPEKDATFTLTNVITLELAKHVDAITKVGEKAGKEYQIELALDKMAGEWEDVLLDVHGYRDTGTFVLKGVDELQSLLDEHVNTTQAMAFSAFKKPFAERIDAWAEALNTVADVLDEWLKVQRSWLYLQPIFDSPDIQKQLPTEFKRFSTVDKNWRSTMLGAKGGSAANATPPKAIAFCNNEKLLERFRESNKFLELVQKGLSDYLETKRSGFARFYFLSNDELLEILSQTKDPRAVQPHLKKCFEGVRTVDFADDGRIVGMVSGEKERVAFVNKVDPKGKNVEHWMSELEAAMMASVRAVMYDAVVDYTAVPRTDWTQKWPGQCVLNASQLHWTREIEEGIRSSGAAGVAAVYEAQLAQLRDMVVLIRSPLPPLAKMTLGALTVIDVHARDVTKSMAAAKVAALNDFEWISNLRYYWTGDGKVSGDMTVQMVSSIRPYGYEYLGNSLRLVITPLTDKCYMTLMGALQMQLGGAPAGPAGTGKTETTKDLAKALAKQCVVFNCSDGLDYLAMGKFFKGLSSCGAWACFDEFNRIDVEVLSVVAQQMLTLQDAVKSGAPRCMFEGSDIVVNPQYAAFITMNPGYAGRTELPDNLKALFRPVAMMVPDYALIGEIMLFSFGFAIARECAVKMVATFKLCSEQLSSQSHYDYGMRAVKTVITAAGNLKAAHPDENEEVLLYRALRDVNEPKFLAPDIPLFRGIMSDLFPDIARPEIDYGDLQAALAVCAEAAKLQPVPHFLSKCIQIYETVVVRHGMMVVGPTGGGKSAMLRTTKDGLSLLASKGKKGAKIERVAMHTLNPKSITMGQLYGEFDPNTHEWTDGILAGIIRECASDPSPTLKWVVFDGPVDALWIENMNTVLDDNKKLCLVSGEIITLSNEMTMMFEVEDLAVASPATVSRCGMVYTEPQSLGVDVLVQSWMESLPHGIFTPPMRTQLQLLLDTFVRPSLAFLRRHLAEPVPTVDSQLVRSLLNILDCLFEPYIPREGRDAVPAEGLRELGHSLPQLFLFALVWSIAATTDGEGRRRFDAFLRAECLSQGFVAAGSARPASAGGAGAGAGASQASLVALAPLLPPEGAMLYDFAFDLGHGLGGFLLPKTDATVPPKDGSAGPSGPRWVPWMGTAPAYEVPARAEFSELIIPTKDGVRYKYLTKQLLTNRRAVMMTGPTGTGKTVNMAELLGAEMPKEFVPIALTFSAQTSANQTQDLIDGKLERRQRSTFGPTAGSVYVLFVDDLNMPQKETYGAQPPIELLRQYLDYGGWYDRKERSFRRIVDTVLLAAMGPPGGGRNPITGRAVRHFNVINATPLDDESLHIIFDTILNSFVATFSEGVRSLAPAVVTATLAVYNTIADQLLPTPSKPHYTFNLRDLGKVFQGLLMADAKKVVAATDFARLWVHESRRVFADRLVNDADRAWFDGQMRIGVEGVMKLAWDDVLRPGQARLLFGDYTVPGADPKIYTEVENVVALQPVIEEYLNDYNAESKTPMKLVLFLDAIEHVSRIARVLRQPQGNALLLGVGGSGRQSLTRLAAFIQDYELVTVEIAKGYGKNEWRDDIRKLLLKAGLEEKPLVFLFNDTQIVFEGMMEDMNAILNSGDVPNLYSAEDMDAIMNGCKQECVKRRIAPTKINIFAQYLLRVRRNIHVVLCMSPMGDAFRSRLRMFPALVNCCAINWFSEWPEEALRSVAMSTLTETDLALGDLLPLVVDFFRSVHLGVAKASGRYLESLRRYNYVTPTSYLELLSTFRSVLTRKRDEVGTLRSRLQTGLDKIISTEAVVSKLQTELVAMQPQLEATQAEVAVMIEQLERDRASAAETKAIVEKEEAEAMRQAAETKAIADSASADLAKALPALEEAVRECAKLKKSDMDELRKMLSPPRMVKVTFEAACIMFGIKPKIVNDSAGKKVKDYWSAALMTLLADSKEFLNSMREFDKDNIPEAVIAEVTPYVEDPEFTFENVDKSSKACSGICLWVRAMHTYYHVNKSVEPKKRALAVAQETLDRTMEQLEKVKARLGEVMDNIAKLQATFDEANGRKEQLAKDVALCAARLDRAKKLIGGLGGEKSRWTTQVTSLNAAYTNVVGDALVASSTIAYLGAFTSEFRHDLVKTMHEELTRLALPHTPGCTLISTLADPVQVRAWNLAGLATDAHSTENGLIMALARRWPLMVDPQGQANRYVRNMGKDKAVAVNGLEVLRQSDRRFLQTLENCIRFGKWCLIENVGESLDAALEPVLLRLVFKQGGSECIRLGDSVVPYSSDFRLFLSTNLPNPHYAPEVSVKISLLNFTVTPKGLEDQLLGTFVVTELPELEERKNALMLSNARNRKELADIENRILYLLSNSTGNILDDEELIDTLSTSKVKAEDISKQVRDAEVTEREIDTTREKYRPVAFRASILYFCITDLSGVDPMYQYSLPWFTNLFVGAIRSSTPSPDIPTRIGNLNDAFTSSVYRNVCRSLFERHKQLFSFLMAVKILQGDNRVDPSEWRFLISGQADAPEGADAAAHNPDPDWVTDKMWSEVRTLSSLPAFAGLAAALGAGGDGAALAAMRGMYDSNDSHRCPPPPGWVAGTAPAGREWNSLQRMCFLRCVRPDKLMLAVQDFIIEHLGQPFVEPPPFDLSACYTDSTVSTPLIFVLSAGSDPTRAFFSFSETAGMRSKVEAISLGQGQGALAATLIAEAQVKGSWVLLQNCHLASSWMGDLERIVEAIEPDKVSRDFRLWLTSMPSKTFPVSVLQNGVKMTNEPPKGLRANLRNFFYQLDDDALQQTTKPAAFRKLLFGLAWFHAVVQERKRFGPLGWNRPYDFNNSDMEISMRQLMLFLDEYAEIPYKVLHTLTSYINYGGRVTDDKDSRTIDVILRDYFTAAVLSDEYKFTPSGLYYAPTVASDDETPHKTFMAYIDGLPLNADPEVFGMHFNANITCDSNETDETLDIVLSLQPRTAGGGGKSRDDIVSDTAKEISAKLPDNFDIDAISMRYPVLYEESMNTVLVQECIRYNRLLAAMKRSLSDIRKALVGQVVMSKELDEMGTALHANKVPGSWEDKAYPSLKPLSAWVADLVERLKFIGDWVDAGAPAVFWISGFFFPQAFLTGTLQNFARRKRLPIDTLSFDFRFLNHRPYEGIEAKPEDGCYIRGLFLEGARFDQDGGQLADSIPKQLYTQLPVIHLLPLPNRPKPTAGIYLCPVYKILSRWGVLATTGHSSNFVMFIELPTDKPTIANNVGEADCAYWIKAGVAAFTSLRY